jgi:hypothetical protein
MLEFDRKFYFVIQDEERTTKKATTMVLAKRLMKICNNYQGLIPFDGLGKLI